MQTEQQKLDLVREVILLETFPQRHLDLLPTFQGPAAERGQLVGALHAAIRAGDDKGERALTRQLSETLFDAGIDYDRAAQLGVRSCEQSNRLADYFLLATRLNRAGLFGPLADLSGGSLQGDQGPLRLLVAEASFFQGRGAQALENYQGIGAHSASAALAMGRLAALARHDPSVAHAAREQLTTLAAQLPDQAQRVLAAARAFDLAPSDPHAAEFFAQTLCASQRVYAADEVWRQYGLHSGDSNAWQRRNELAHKHGLPLLRLTALLDGCLDSSELADGRADQLKELLDEEELRVEWGPFESQGRSLVTSIVKAIRTRSSMGRGYALVRAARKLHGAARALLLAFAAEAYVAAGNLRRALEEARAACSAAPWLPRAQAALLACQSKETSAETLLHGHEFEQALAALPPLSSNYRAAATQSLTDGCNESANIWCQMWLQIAVDDGQAWALLCRIAVGSQDTDMLTSCMRGIHRSWLAPKHRAKLLAACIEQLKQQAPQRLLSQIESLDLGRLAALGELQDVLDDVLATAPETRAKLCVLRAASSTASDQQRATLWLQAARLAAEVPDDELATEHLRTACQLDPLVAGAADLLLEIRQRESETTAGDQRIATTELLIDLCGQGPQEKLTTLRQLGALRWDLANDPIGAESAFYLASHQGTKKDFITYGTDLFDRGKAAAKQLIENRANAVQASENGLYPSASLLAATALAAQRLNLRTIAADLAHIAVQKDPNLSCAIVLLEQLGCDQQQWDKVHALYNHVAVSAAGRHGAHAAHYRATRVFEHHGQNQLAAQHACLAFEALPTLKASYGTVLRLMAPIENEDATNALCSKALADAAPAQRSEWFHRFAILGIALGEKHDQTIALLLHAIELAPSLALTITLQRACCDLLPSQATIEAQSSKFRDTISSVLQQLRSSTEAAIATTLTSLALRPFKQHDLAGQALIKTLELRPEELEIEHIHEEAEAFAALPDLAHTLTRRLGEFCRNRSAGDDLLALYEILSKRFGAYETASSPPSPSDAPPASAEGKIDTLRSDVTTPPAAASKGPSMAAQERRKKLFGPDDSPRTALKSAHKETQEQDPAKAMPTPMELSSEAEQQARAAGDYEWVAQILEQRAAQEPSLPRRRLIRLRRAAVLEQRLQRPREACKELEAVLRECGDDPTTLRYIANLYASSNRHSEAADAWLLTSQLSNGSEAHVQDVLNCCEAYIKAKRAASARRLVDSKAELASLPSFHNLRSRIADHFVAVDRADEPSSESPQTAPSALHPGTAAPAATPPSDADTTALDPLRSLERLKERLLGTTETTTHDAAQAIAELMAIDTLLPDKAHDLHTFVLVQFLRMAESEESIEHQLQYHWEAFGQTPLVSILVAEGLIQRGEHSAAIALYQWLLGEELGDIVDRGRVALTAAEAAIEADDPNRQRYFLGIALSHESTQVAARKQLTRLDHQQSSREEGNDNGGALENALKSLRWDSVPPSEPAHDVPELDLEIPLKEAPLHGADTDSSTVTAIEYQPTFDDTIVESGPIITLRKFGTATGMLEEKEPPPSVRIEDVDLASQPDASEFDEFDAIDDWALDLGTQVETPTSEPFPISRRLESTFTAESSRLPGLIDEPKPISYSSHPPPRTVSKPFSGSASESSLLDELMEGDFEAGEALVKLYGPDPVRSHDRLMVRQRQASLRRGDLATLERLHEAAVADKNRPLGAAVRHVIGSFAVDRRPAVTPPALNTLPMQAYATSKLLFQPIEDSVNEALAIVNTTGLLRKGLVDYGITGTDRLPTNATTPLGRLFGDLSRLVDLDGARLFHVHRNDDEIQTEVVLTSPLALLVSGALRELRPNVVYKIATGCARATPALALLEGLEHARASSLIRALRAAFGPAGPSAVAGSNVDDLRLIEELWHWVPRQDEKRLRQICSSPQKMTYENALRRSRATAARVGLFATGSLAVAIEETLPGRALRYDPLGRITTPLTELCKVPNIAELFDLALRPEYAEARWRSVGSIPPARTSVNDYES